MSCAHCNKPFALAEKRRRPRKYCSDLCRRRAQTKQRSIYGGQTWIICQGYDRFDKKCYTSVLVGGRGRPYPYCSHECFLGHRRVIARGQRGDYPRWFRK